MSRAIRAIVWEILWKNRWAFPVLFLLWGVGCLMAHVHNSPPDAWWAGNPFHSTLLAFLVSVVMVFAPFTLMESHGSWRMNSMTTRWCLRPLPAWILVAVPLLLGWTALVLSLVWLMQTWAAGGLWGVLAIVLLVPLARVSACPLAMARNRNR